MKDRVKKLLADYEDRHTDFQIDNFIVGCAGDAWAQYKQALREIKARYDILKGKYPRLKRVRAGLDALKERAGDKRSRINYQRLYSLYKSLAADVSKTYGEFKRFVALAEALKAEIGEITPEKRKRLEQQSWVNKARRLVAIDVISSGRIGPQTVDFIFSLPTPMAFELLGEIREKPATQLFLESRGETYAIEDRIKTGTGAGVRTSATAMPGPNPYNFNPQAFRQRGGHVG